MVADSVSGGVGGSGGGATSAVLARVRRRRRRIGCPSPLRVMPHPCTHEALQRAFDVVEAFACTPGRKLNEIEAQVAAWSFVYLAQVLRDREEPGWEHIVEWVRCNELRGQIAAWERAVVCAPSAVSAKVAGPARMLSATVTPFLAPSGTESSAEDSDALLTPPASPMMEDSELSLRACLARSTSAPASLVTMAAPSSPTRSRSNSNPTSSASHRSGMKDRDRMRRTALESRWLDMQPRVTTHAQAAADEADHLRLGGAVRLRYIRRGLVRRLREDERQRQLLRVRSMRKRKLERVDSGNRAPIFVSVMTDTMMVDDENTLQGQVLEVRPSKRFRAESFLDESVLHHCMIDIANDEENVDIDEFDPLFDEALPVSDLPDPKRRCFAQMRRRRMSTSDGAVACSIPALVRHSSDPLGAIGMNGGFIPMRAVRC